MTKHKSTPSHGRLGRPPKPADTVRSERVVSFVTPVEYRQLESISERKSMSLSAVVHSMVVRSLEEHRRNDRKRQSHQPTKEPR